MLGIYDNGDNHDPTNDVATHLFPPALKQTTLDYRRLSEIFMNTTPQFPQLVATQLTNSPMVYNTVR